MYTQLIFKLELGFFII